MLAKNDAELRAQTVNTVLKIGMNVSPQTQQPSSENEEDKKGVDEENDNNEIDKEDERMHSNCIHLKKLSPYEFSRASHPKNII